MTSHSEPAHARQDNLFGWQPSPSTVPDIYPGHPGYRGAHNGTSAQAARSIANNAKSLRGQTLKLIKEAPNGLTSDEVARLLDLPNVYSSRPRVAELHRQGEIVDSGERRISESGRWASVWKAAPPLPNYPHIVGEARS